MNKPERTVPEAPEPDYSPDEAQLLLTEWQLRHLGELRIMAMEVARDVAAGSKPEKPADLAFARISKIVMQITVLEQQTAGLRDKQRVQMKIHQVRAKKEAVTHAVRAAFTAAHPARDLQQRDTLMRGIIQSYDFSDPRKVAAIVADICKALGVPFKAEIWPAGDAADAEKAPAEAVEVAELVKSTGTQPKLDGAGSLSAEVAAFAPVLAAQPSANGHDPP